MLIGNFNWGDFSQVFINYGTADRTRAVAAGSRTPGTDQRQQIQFALGHVQDLRRALQTIDKTWRRSSGSVRTVAASAASATDLGLAAPTSAYVESAEEVNATPTSYATHGPAWGGPSTAEMTVGGVYDGSLGTDTLTFRVNQAGLVGQDELRVLVFNSLGDKVDDFQTGAADPAGTAHTLASGLVVSFGPGDLVKNDTATLAVFADVGTAVDPDAAFDGVRLSDPDLQYGLEVTAGSFEVNGVAVAVNADDSLATVLARISAAGAGVTATYSALTERVTLVSDTPGSEGAVVLANDTSGFLAAAKLAGATPVPGTDVASDRLMAEVDRFAAVTAGDLILNGVAVAFDPAADTLQAVIDRINAADAGVTATVDATGRAVTFTAVDPEADLTLADGETGLLAALEIAGGTFAPERAKTFGGAMTRHRAHRLTGAMQEVAKAFNALYGLAVPGQEAGSWLTRCRQDLQTVMAGFLEETPTGALARIGLDFEGTAGQDLRFSFSEKDRGRMASALLKSPQSVENLLFRTRSSATAGLVDDLGSRLEVIATYLDGALGSTGVFIDTTA